MMTTVEIEVMDKDICSKCCGMDVICYPKEVVKDGQVVGSENHYRCKKKYFCDYLYKLFRSAKETPSKIEEAKSNS